jgi:hypothetical protein
MALGPLLIVRSYTLFHCRRRISGRMKWYSRKGCPTYLQAFFKATARILENIQLAVSLTSFRRSEAIIVDETQISSDPQYFRRSDDLEASTSEILNSSHQIFLQEIVVCSLLQQVTKASKLLSNDGTTLASIGRAPMLKLNSRASLPLIQF